MIPDILCNNEIVERKTFKNKSMVIRATSRQKNATLKISIQIMNVLE
ncbi:unnamed protein product, partial [Allacma fusca]